jgi:DNA-binding MarR family transcriptional regulator
VTEESELKDSLSAQAALLSELMAQHMEPDLRRVGLGASGFEILSALRAIQRSATQAQLAARLGITPPSLSEALKSLVAAGLITQTPSRIDARAKTLRLTSKGGRILSELLRSVNLAERRMVEGIDPDDLRRAVAVLRTANRNLVRGFGDR